MNEITIPMPIELRIHVGIALIVIMIISFLLAELNQKPKTKKK